jgi:release factor glutamine methyltransferase
VTEQPAGRLDTALASAAARLVTGSDSPRLDASVLLCHVLDCPRSFLLSHPESPLLPAQAIAFEALVDRRARGEPVAYLTGTKEFWSLDLQVTPDVLVPRPETELLVEAALERLPAGAAGRVADIGTGSGAIALALASERPGLQVIATELSPAAMAVARGNARRLGLAIEFREGDGCMPLHGECFDLIASNPPYIAPGDPHLAALRHEPHLALVAADAGLAMLRRLIRCAPALLGEGGWLLLEHGDTQGGAVRDMLREAGFSGIGTRTDLAGLERVSLGRRAGPSPASGSPA